MNLTDLNSTPRDEFLIVNAYPNVIKPAAITIKWILTTMCSQYLQSSESQQAYHGNAQYEQRMGPHLRRPSKASRNVIDHIQQMELRVTICEKMKRKWRRNVDSGVESTANPDNDFLGLVLTTAFPTAC